MKNKILIVDDEESIRYTFENFLSEEGHVVSTAGSFDDAIKLISETDFDLIFADIILGGKNGIDLLKKVRSMKPSCPVVMITGYPNIETATDAVRLGAFDYISKPVRNDALIHTTLKALQHKALQDENDKFRANLEAIFRSVRDAIITVDENCLVLEVNDAAKAMCGIGRESVGKPFSSVQSHCSKYCLHVIEKTIRTKQIVEESRVECNRKGRHSMVVTITASPLLDRHGSFTGAVMVMRDETRLNHLERNLGERHHFRHIMGRNVKMQKIYSLMDDLGDVQTTVLITGESGTGKELVAEAIHYSGERSMKPLVKVNCSALSESLLESELFGHVRGAFTGAERDRIGRFQKADGGTVFLDEIGDISRRMQLRLLRVLQEKTFERVGDSTPITVDVRVIAATNQNLYEKVRRGAFREDLYYRLKVVEIDLPPLRDRKDDIPLLLEHFIQKLNTKFNKMIESVSTDVLRIFMDYNWPGNVREMEHALEHAFIICRQRMITADQLPEYLRSFQRNQTHAMNGETGEEEALLSALKKTGWNKSKAARLLGVNVRTIYRKMDKYNIKSDEE